MHTFYVIFSCLPVLGRLCSVLSALVAEGGGSSRCATPASRCSGFLCRRAPAPGARASVIAATPPGSGAQAPCCGSRASSPLSVWVLPRPGLDRVSPAGAFMLRRSVLSSPLDPLDPSPPGCSVHEIFQARVLEQVAVSSPRGSSQPED